MIDRKEVEALKPCDFPCEKCGHADVQRKFRANGETWHIDEYAKPHNRYASASSHMATAFRDHIAHTCRCCGFRWQTLPMRKPKRVRLLPAGPDGGSDS